MPALGPALDRAGFFGALAHAQAPAANLGGRFELVDHNGKAFSSATLAGTPYAIFFGFTNCPDICPTTLLLMSNALARLGPDGGTAVCDVQMTVRNPEAAIAGHWRAFRPVMILLSHHYRTDM
ncbi:MAG TPA: SCO family protein [Hyphomicrobiaceae bacterium]|nr:SCO family protein [Hyphomicrobiaceae bacterium]